MTGSKKKLRQQRNLRHVFELYGNLRFPCHVALSLSLGAHNKRVSGSLRCTRSTKILASLGLQIPVIRYIKFQPHPCEKLLNANIIGESDGTNINL